jgi:hypothetical protein
MALLTIEINDLHIPDIKVSQEWKNGYDPDGVDTIADFIGKYLKQKLKADCLEHLEHTQKVTRNDADTAAVLADRAAVQAKSAAMADMD